MGRYTTITYDRALELVHIRYDAAVLETEADVAAFAEEIERGWRDIPKPSDVLVDLGGLVIKPAAAAAYDRERRRMFAAHTTRAFRYGGSPVVRTKVLTSSTIHGQRANVFATYEEALDALRSARAAAKKPGG